MPEWGFEAFRSAVLEGTDTLPKPGQVSGDSNDGKSAEDVVTSEGEPSKGDPEEDDAPAEDKPAEGEAQEGKEVQEEKELKITVRRGRKKTRTFTVNNLGRVMDLQRKIHSWSKVAPKDQRLFCNGIPLPPALGLDSLWDSITIPMAKGMLGGVGFLSWGEKKKRGWKKSAQRAAQKRNTKAAADRFYEETKRMIESRSRPDDEMGYGECTWPRR